MKSTASITLRSTDLETAGRQAIKPRSWAAWIWLLLPLACHQGFSWIGFNPTDEGWLQAIARRIINGEIPHRDFISIRPVLSAVLQIPLVWMGGDHVFWLARLWGWIIAGSIAWLWSGFLRNEKSPVWWRLLLYALIFFLNVHTFPMMAWHSLDGLLFASVAVVLIRRQTIPALRGAFICAGLATLCRQNFVFFIPFLMLGLPLDWRHWRIALWATLPPAIYFLTISCFGGLTDFILQMGASQGLLFQTAISKFGQNSHFLGGSATGLLLAYALRWGRRSQPQAMSWAAGIIAGSIGLYAAFTLWAGPVDSSQSSFVSFGLAGGLGCGTLWRSPLPKSVLFPLIAAMGLAWTVAISAGYNCPALMSGVLLIAIWRALELLSSLRFYASRIGCLASALILASIAASFWHSRMNYPYLDRPAGKLEWEAGDVLRGASGLRTNAITHAVLNDLRKLTDRFDAQHQPYAILTDYSASWVQSKQRNPLNCEWPQSTELGDDPHLAQRNLKLIQRSIQQIGHLPAGTTVIVQRQTLLFVKYGLFPIANAADTYRFQIWFCQHAQLIEQTPYFDLYLAPRWPGDATLKIE